MADKRKAFAAYTAGEARKTASDWLRNFRDHGPLDIRSIKVSPEQDHFIATITYAEMTVDESPRHFENYQPIRRTA